MISTDGSKLFSLVAANVDNENINWNKDSEAIKPGSNAMIDFGSAPAGIYKASLVLIGYGEDGLLYYQPITIEETIIIE
jgi:hypothetical protein